MTSSTSPAHGMVYNLRYESPKLVTVEGAQHLHLRHSAHHQIPMLVIVAGVRLENPMDSKLPGRRSLPANEALGAPKAPSGTAAAAAAAPCPWSP